MAGAFRRAAEKAKGKDGRYTCWWIDRFGKKQTCPGTTDHRKSKQLAEDKEHRERRYKARVADPAEDAREEAAERPIAEHVEDYAAHLAAKGDEPEHVKHTASAIRRLFDLAKIRTIPEITQGRVQGALGRMRAKKPGSGDGLSARTCNYGLGAIKSFVRWMTNDGRMKEFPEGLRAIPRFPEKADRRRVRRPLTAAEMVKLLEATEKSEVVVIRRGSASRWAPITAVVTGDDRAMAYRIAMATGFRAEEVRTLTPERFALDGDNPTITVKAAHSKRGKRTGRDDIQPIRRDMAPGFRAWLVGKPPGKALFPLPPDRTGAILADDCRAAGIDPVDEQGRVIDFHSLRHSYITALAMSGVNLKVVQKLARHSSITLTLDTYTTPEDSEMRSALEGGRTTNAPEEGGR